MSNNNNNDLYYRWYAICIRAPTNSNVSYSMPTSTTTKTKKWIADSKVFDSG